MSLQMLKLMLMLLKWKMFNLMNFIVSIINNILIRCFHQSKQTPNARAYNIKCRHKPSLMMGANPSCFIAIFDSNVDPNIILSDDITLFNITSEEAIFIDAGGEDVFDSSHNAFVYNSQYKLATKLIHLPLDSFHEVASKISLPNIPTMHLANHGRCGSTLLTKMIEAVSGSLSISETMAFADIAQLIQKGDIDQDTGKKLILSSLLCTLKHATTRKSKLVFLKLQHFATYITDLISEVAPDVRQVYMYRQPVPFVRSWEKIIFTNGWKPGDEIWSTVAGFGCFDILKDYPKYNDARMKDLSMFTKIGLVWITCIASFNKLISKGYPLKSLKYEDMMVDPKLTLVKLFHYLSLDESLLPNIDAVMAQDSQKDSDFTSRHIDKKVLERAMTPLTEKLKSEVDSVCRDFDVPSFWEELKLQNSVLS